MSTLKVLNRKKHHFILLRNKWKNKNVYEFLIIFISKIKSLKANSIFHYLVIKDVINADVI